MVNNWDSLKPWGGQYPGRLTCATVNPRHTKRPLSVDMGVSFFWQFSLAPKAPKVSTARNPCPWIMKKSDFIAQYEP